MPSFDVAIAALLAICALAIFKDPGVNVPEPFEEIILFPPES